MNAVILLLEPSTMLVDVVDVVPHVLDVLLVDVTEVVQFINTLVKDDSLGDVLALRVDLLETSPLLS